MQTSSPAQAVPRGSSSLIRAALVRSCGRAGPIVHKRLSNKEPKIARRQFQPLKPSFRNFGQPKCNEMLQGCCYLRRRRRAERGPLLGTSKLYQRGRGAHHAFLPKEKFKRLVYGKDIIKKGEWGT